MSKKRILQFLRAVTARVSTEDAAYVERYLSSAVQPLFFAQSVPDQCHALRAARNAEAIAQTAQDTVDVSLLIRCALLHDVGRKKGDLGTFGKSFAVLFAKFCPALARDYGNGKRSGVLARKMNVFFHHAEMGAAMLSNIGFSQEAEIVRKHHEAPADDDPPELRILRMADEIS
ncbi:MAG: HD domain-containing protein [Schwartzia sp.]|nr:HD domain-containing protein [Schwartzia sp. (in: firmicutes)]